MPYKDPEKKKEQMREWRKRKIDEGYGKWLYARRKVVYANETAFYEAINAAIDHLDNRNLTSAREVLTKALRDAMERGETVGDFSQQPEEEPK